MKNHSKYPPSSAYRWLKCPASVLLAPDEVERDTTAADEGTLAHRIAELKLTADFWNDNEEELTECRENGLYNHEMEGYTDCYVDYVTGQTREGSEVYVETMVDLKGYMPGLFGTCDCIVYNPVWNTLDVIDFKYGKWKVDYKDNPQLMIYALGAADFIKGKRPDTDLGSLTVNMHICQPRIGHTGSSQMRHSEIKKWFESQSGAVEKIRNGVTERNTGDWCRFCDRQIHCRSYQQELMDCYVDDFFSLSDREISLNLERLRDIEKLLQRLRTYAIKQIQEGRKFPGFKLCTVKKKIWKDEDAARKIAKDNGLLVTPTPSQALKKLGKKKFDELFSDQLGHSGETYQLKRER